MLKKKILGLFIIGLGFLGITNAEIQRITFNNAGQIARFESPLSGENDYRIMYKGFGNWSTLYSGTQYNNIWKLTNINWNGSWSRFFWNTGNKLTFGGGGIGLPERRKIVEPENFIHLNYSGYKTNINDIESNYNFNANDFYNLTGNITEFSMGVNIPNDNSVSARDYRYLCFTFNNNDTYCTACATRDTTYGTICLGGQNEYLPLTGGANTNSLIYTYTIEDYKQYIGTSSFAGGSTGGTEEITGGGTLYCPPIKYEIDLYGRNYNTGLCYSNTEEITGGQVISTTPITIFEAFPTYEAYRQAYNLIQQNCHTDTVNTVEQCQTALQAIGKKPAQILLKLIISNIPEGTSIAKVYQYCHLQLDYTEEEKRNTSTCDLKEDGTFYATGVTQNNSSNPNTLEGLTEALQNSDQTIVIPEDGTIFDDMLPDGIISRKDAILNIDLRTTRTQLTIKIMKLFKTRPIVEGMLPPIITSLLLLIVLFKIFKK